MLNINSGRALFPMLVALAISAGGCAQPAQLALSVGNQSASNSKAATSVQPPPVSKSPSQPSVLFTDNTSAQNQAETATQSVKILQVHFRGSLQPQGCCNPGLYEKDEFVVIQNTRKAPQHIAGRKLVNVTKGHPSFTFPRYFPCLPFAPSKDEKYVANTTNYVSSAPQTIEQMFADQRSRESAQQSDTGAKIDWSSCSPVKPLDETPMSPVPGQPAGQLLPCVLYPGQIVLVFTDEIHCQYGGLTFSYGRGNIWDNEKPDTAVLYNTKNEEVSRRSYTTGN